jgi:hypothetical protein
MMSKRTEVRIHVAAVALIIGLALAAVAQWSTPPTGSGTTGWYTPPGSETNGAVGVTLTNAYHAGNSSTGGVSKVGRQLAITFPAAGTGDLLAANNLSDLDNAATARTNLGLDTASTNPASAFESAGSVSAHNSTNTAHATLFAEARTNATHINGVAVATVTAGAALGATASQPGHTQAISTVTGLQAALDGKSATNHNHTGTYALVSEPVATQHIDDASEAHLQSAVDAARTVTTIAADQAAGTQTVTLVKGSVLRCRILATNSSVVIKYDMPALPATNRTWYAALEHYNPNARTVTWDDTIYWSSNGTATATALTLGKYAEVHIKGSTYYYAIRGMTNSTELGAP